MKQSIKILIILLLILAIGSGILMIWLPFMEAFRIIFGTSYVVFLPGFVWTYFFFKNQNLDIIERITLSCAISLILVPTAMFFANAFGLKMNFNNSFWLIFGLVVMGLLLVIANALIFHSKDKND